jgi:hypothetical protein
MATAVGKPGTNWKQVGPADRKKIAPIVRHYMKSPHPFTACVRDNTKRFGPERAKRICAVVKDMGARTTKWRKGGKGRVAEAPSDVDYDALVEQCFDEVVAPVLDAEGVTVDELADWSEMCDAAGVLESVEITDPEALVAAAPSVQEAAKLSRTKRRPGESLKSWGQRLKADDRALNADKDKGRDGTAKDSEFERAHPRGRGGQWILKRGAKGEAVKTVQRKVGAKTDGEFGQQTARLVRQFQREHGLQVDGIVGKQTAAALLGNENAADVAVGKMTPEQARKLGAAARRRRRARVRQSAGGLDDDLAVLAEVEIGDPAEIVEAARGVREAP